MIKLIKSSFYKEKKTKQALEAFITQAEILSFDEQCKLFEKNFAIYQGRKEAVFVNSGSSANLAIVQALLNLGYLKKGDNVGFSAITWSTNVMPLIQLGLNPVPVDVELETLNISAQTLEKTLNNSKIRMLFLTNLLGFSDQIDQVQAVCKKHKIILIEDSCESMGTVYKGKKLGNFGLASTFSFYVGHHLSTIEGGMICTDDEELSAMLRIVRAHGWDRNLSELDQAKVREEHSVNSSFYSRYTFYDLGYNLRPTEIGGFLGNFQLQFIEEIVSRRQKNFLQLSLIYKNPLFYKVKWDHLDVISNFAVPIVCKDQNTKNKLVDICNGKVEIRPIVGGNMTNQPFYKKYIKNNGEKSIVNANLIHQNGFYFGNNPELTQKEIKYLIDLFNID
ncbi:DegT/DnrJ/EryC1/StrS aminotransferase family protein [Patescibacteria group bacterium]|nr:DegT/DnrJ/EryC1/StrS aminotransferase family protein [Patescibacteria group bacterium]